MIMIMILTHSIIIIITIAPTAILHYSELPKCQSRNTGQSAPTPFLLLRVGSIATHMQRMVDDAVCASPWRSSRTSAASVCLTRRAGSRGV